MTGIEKLATFCKKHIKIIILVCDFFALLLAANASAYLKFDAPNFFPEWFRLNGYVIIAFDAVATFLMFSVRKINNRMWQYPVPKDYADLIIMFCLSKLTTMAGFSFIWLAGNFKKREFATWFFLYCVIFGVSVLAIRAAVVLGYHIWRKKFLYADITPGVERKRILIIGAGDAANRLISELKGSKYQSRFEVVALIDDNKRKVGEYLNGVKVFGGREKILETVTNQRVDEIYFAVPSASDSVKKEILDICKETNCVLKTLPKIDTIKSDTQIGALLRKVDYTDLLGRKQIKPDLTAAFDFLRDKTVLVTGGGGSIGSELVRQIAHSGAPKTIVIFDIAENGAYDIQQEIRRALPEVDLHVLIGSVRDEQRLQEVFEEYRPDIVYHAAAHKHVPLMEDSPKEAVKNNVFGTFNLARTADKYGVKRFVMISTDKAVNPTNVMGATKRVCEMIVQSFNRTSSTEFVAVRFGNVLGSNGSVIPLFKEQIESGGPVTVTHPDIIRYFMLIPEAVSLVLQAGTFAHGGEIFILDMGSPVKIRELAENLIKLSGYRPGIDIEIKFTGLREGEKLYEELLISEEGIQKTANDLVYVAKPVDIDVERLFSQLTDLDDNIERFTRTEMIEKLSEIVPTYTPNNSEYSSKAH